MTKYRFYSNFKHHDKDFATDDEAFQYASDLTDGPWPPLVLKYMDNIQWYEWNLETQEWELSKEDNY